MMASGATTSSDKATKANEIIKWYAIGSAVPGLIPVAVVDIPLIFAVQLKMLHAICQVYETPFSAELGRSVLASLFGSGGSSALGVGARYTAASLAKGVPVFGTAAGVAGTAAAGSATAYAIGKVFVQHFETGGTLLTFNADKLRDHYLGSVSEPAKDSGATSSFVPVKP